MKYSVIIVAAGKGTRTGLTYNKVFYKINNEPIICKTLRPFLTDEDCERIVISIAPTEQKDFESLITSPKVVLPSEVQQDRKVHILDLQKLKVIT